MTWWCGPEYIMFKYESDPNFSASDPNTWYDGDLLKFKDERVIGTQHLFSILKTKTKENRVRILVNKLGHGEWYNIDEVVWVARPLFP